MNSSRSPFIFLRDLKLSVVVPVFNEGPNIIENLYLEMADTGYPSLSRTVKQLKPEFDGAKTIWIALR